ncbi:alpha-amylase family glycosyl hydrolase [Sphingomonas sp. LY160]|uniref:alpha-amylase family glycosyl hydrolase n=1 Tax=Sphingomonas sp. LY160 TaxID=3095342 RepID=UPI002ADED78C|nr:alpha-amylase family glycosyl hydrolase [Sphingomonas sp. LY160]MEA1072894.1 alpha-amylase family glycosyl hydrolase [Sphingomonas sp. LY160]
MAMKLCGARTALGIALGALVAGALVGQARAQSPADSVRTRLPEDEVIYFLLPDRFENGDTANDRGGLRGDRLAHGFDPTAKGFFHGGDLKGLTKRLDYIQGMGVTAVWVAPIFKNKPVQGAKGKESAGYHGYWITDFTSVDPHLGTNADFEALVDAAHARGMKVYMDIITNHTADVIQLAECAGTGECAYRSIADYPYQRKGGPKGAAINPGFAGDGVRTTDNFARLTDPNWAYTVRVPSAERSVKKPSWLNNPIYYHNRGDTLFRNESSTMGDFVGLDDLFTEHPRVVQGMIDIYGEWIDRYGIDGFRIDTARHVNPEFWQAFAPAMIARAKARGIPNFHIFGEVYTDAVDPAFTAIHTVRDGLPTTLDFAFAAAVKAVVAGKAPTSTMAGLFHVDPLYKGGDETARRLPTFLGNHDMGRVGHAIRTGFPQATDEEQLNRSILAHAMLLTLRGVPTIYSGDEQGFAGDGGDQDSREDMFPSKVAVYNDNKLIGTAATTATANFDTAHPLYRTIGVLSRLRTSTPALTRGRQLLRHAGDGPGLFAVSRFDPTTGKEVLLVFNTSTETLTQNVRVEVGSTQFSALAGQCATSASAPGVLGITLPALGYAVCAAR